MKERAKIRTARTFNGDFVTVHTTQTPGDLVFLWIETHYGHGQVLMLPEEAIALGTRLIKFGKRYCRSDMPVALGMASTQLIPSEFAAAGLSRKELLALCKRCADDARPAHCAATLSQVRRNGDVPHAV
jgi:hypothetical protein